MAFEIGSILFRKSVGALGRDARRCARCRRVPLPGEMLHELESHRVVCQLCLSTLPESKRGTVGCERVPVSDRRLNVTARAA
jgi:hypothetical protein